MLAARWEKPFVDPAWGFEMKWDGVRILFSFDGEQVKLRSRTGKVATPFYPELQAFDPGRPVILDGEVVSLDDAGRPSFERLQRRMNVTAPGLVAAMVEDVPISYVVFDVLFDEAPLVDRPWHERRDRLAAFELPDPFVRSQFVDRDPMAMWGFVQERRMEGIVGKRLASVYRPGTRSPDWRKVSHFRFVNAIVGGFSEGDGRRTGTFGSLVLGVHDEDGLRWVGSVGSGFKHDELRAIRAALDEMTIPESPFTHSVDMPRPVTWVDPQLVARVQYKEWTSAGRLRAPSFKGFTDAPPEEVTWESEGPDAPG